MTGPEPAGRPNQKTRTRKDLLEAASRQFAAQGVIFVGVSYEDEPSDSTRFLQQYGVTYPVGTDGSAKTPGAIAIAYGVLAPPETYFINRSGVVVDEFSGPLSANLLDQPVEFEGFRRVHAGRRFVQQHELRLGCQGAGNL